MQIVIELSKEELDDIKNNDYIDNTYYTMFDAITNGVVLPKGHGKLIDINNINVIELEDSLHIIRHEKGDDVDVYIDAPTVVEADKD